MGTDAFDPGAGLGLYLALGAFLPSVYASTARYPLGGPVCLVLRCATAQKQVRRMDVR